MPQKAPKPMSGLTPDLVTVHTVERVWRSCLLWNCQWRYRLNNLGSPCREVPVFPRTAECLLGTVGSPLNVLCILEVRLALSRAKKSLQASFK